MLYHLVPQKLVGSYLLPLADLRRELPELYAKHKRKYAGRELLLEDWVPGLECLWSQVLFLTALPPYRVRELHQLAGLELPSIRWFEIDPEQLDTGRLQVYWYHYTNRERKFVKNNWSPYSRELLPALQRVPEGTLEHYRKAARAGERPFAFFRTPHVLYKGRIEISKLRIVSSRANSV